MLYVANELAAGSQPPVNGSRYRGAVIKRVKAIIKSSGLYR